MPRSVGGPRPCMVEKGLMHLSQDTFVGENIGEKRAAPRAVRLRDLRRRDLLVLAEALLILAPAQLAVRLAGLHRTFEWAKRLVSSNMVKASAVCSAGEVEHIAQLIRGFCRRWPFRATCLDRSLLTVTLLSRRRVPVALCMGFRKDDSGLEGHAWVEHDGCSLLETVDMAGMSRETFFVPEIGRYHSQGEPPESATK
jgi:hypothetical protein